MYEPKLNGCCFERDIKRLPLMRRVPEMSETTVRIRIIHPFIRFSEDVILRNDCNSLKTVMKILVEKAGEHGRFGHMGRQRIDRLRGCIVMRNGIQVGHFDDNEFAIEDGVDLELRDGEEITVMLPIAGG